MATSTSLGLRRVWPGVRGFEGIGRIDALSERMALALTLAIGAFVLLPTFGYGLGFDHGVLHYVAWGALRGRWPYGDLWDTSFPGVLPIHMAAVALGGQSALSLRVLDFGFQLATAGLLYAVGRRLHSPAAGLAAAPLYLIAYVSGGYMNTAQRDGFMVPLLLFVLLMLWDDVYARRGRLAGAGFLLGFVCLIRPTYALIAVAAGIAILLRERDAWTKRLVRVGCWFAVPGLLPTVFFIGAYAAAGRLDAVRDTLVYLGGVYRDLDRKSLGHVVLKLFMDSPQTLWAGMALCPLALGAPRARRGLAWMGGLFALMLVVRFIEAKTYRYQFWPPLACAASMAGVGWAAALDRLSEVDGRIRRIALPILLSVAFVIPLVTTRPVVAAFDDLGPSLRSTTAESPAFESLVAATPEQAALARYLREHTAPDDLLLLWGPGAGVYYAAERFPASRFFVSTAFLCVDDGGDPTRLRIMTKCNHAPPPVQSRFHDEFLRDVRRAAFIVTIASDESFDVWDGEFLAPDFPELRAIVTRDYEVETVIGRWAVRKRKPG
jgi:dolichyl-phosphate-mannose-protein mannosyltransferase